jgi:hypothetical protein
MQRCYECFGYPSEFGALPLGYCVFQNFQVHVVNAEIARMILYHYDFVDGSCELNYRGKAQLLKIVHLMPSNFAPLVIEATPQTPGLDEARRLTVVNVLASAQFPVPPERVVIGTSLTPGLSGREAERIYGNLLNQIQQRGLLGGGGFSSTGTTGTSGGGFGSGGGSGQGGMSGQSSTPY